MSLIDYENLSSIELISQYILEYLGKGVCLSASDYQIIKNWIDIVNDPDVILVILHDILENNKKNKKFISLKNIDKKVKNRIKCLKNN